MRLSNKDKLEMYGDYLNEFKNPVVNRIVKKVIVNTPTIFFGVSTSSTGKNHPSATNGVAGLVKHSVATMLIAKDMLRNDTMLWIFKMTGLTELDKEIILAACLIHDNAKYGSKDKEEIDVKYYTEGNHPRLIKEIAENAGLYNELKGEDLEILNRIIKLIETHMGQWVKVKDEEDLDKPSSYAQAFVHMCDYIVSRKTFDNVSEIGLPNDINPELIQWFKTQV